MNGFPAIFGRRRILSLNQQNRVSLDVWVPQTASRPTLADHETVAPDTKLLICVDVSSDLVYRSRREMTLFPGR